MENSDSSEEPEEPEAESAESDERPAQPSETEKAALRRLKKLLIGDGLLMTATYTLFNRQAFVRELITQSTVRLLLIIVPF